MSDSRIVVSSYGGTEVKVFKDGSHFADVVHIQQGRDIVAVHVGYDGRLDKLIEALIEANDIIKSRG